VATATAAHAAPVLESTTEPHEGIVVEQWVDASPTEPLRLHLVRVNLTSAEIGVYATAEADKGITPAEYASRTGAQVVINGDAFSVSGWRPLGLAAADGVPWTQTADDDHSAVLHFLRSGDERTRATIEPPELITQYDQLPSGTSGVVSGRPLLVRAGAVESAFDCDDPITLACVRAPRSAVGLSADGNTLTLVVVDGWQEASIGMTALELATFLVARSVHLALAFDSGSSSALVLDGVLASSPSDGVQRAVANHLAVKHGNLPSGRLLGVICTGSVSNCGRVADAEVTLDDGRVETTGADGFYEFAPVSPRLACVTVRKNGYLTTTQCKQIDLDDDPGTFLSIVLQEGDDPPDGGVSDASIPPDAAELVDGPLPPDGGNPLEGEPPAGCCAQTRGGDLGGAWLVAFVAWLLARRRGTTTPA